jgi:competence protein ComGF
MESMISLMVIIGKLVKPVKAISLALQEEHNLLLILEMVIHNSLILVLPILKQLIMVL